MEGRAAFECARAHLGPGRAEGGHLAAVWPEPSDSGKPFKPAEPVSCSLPRRPSRNRPHRGCGGFGERIRGAFLRQSLARGIGCMVGVTRRSRESRAALRATTPVPEGGSVRPERGRRGVRRGRVFVGAGRLGQRVLLAGGSAGRVTALAAHLTRPHHPGRQAGRHCCARMGAWSGAGRPSSLPWCREDGTP